eukprot:Skav236635  [mRNA]  locus=scaffold2276:179569:181724:- [translate_table: standard]
MRHWQGSSCKRLMWCWSHVIRLLIFGAHATEHCEIHATSEGSLDFSVHLPDGSCQVVYSESAEADEINGSFLVFTDDLEKVPFAGRRGRLVFLERLGDGRPALDSILEMKDHLLSILLPPQGAAGTAASTTWVGD